MKFEKVSGSYFSHFTTTDSRGNTYNIEFAGAYDMGRDFLVIWKCDCPVGRSDYVCKHLRAFLNQDIPNHCPVCGEPQEIDFEACSDPNCGWTA